MNLSDTQGLGRCRPGQPRTWPSAFESIEANHQVWTLLVRLADEGWLVEFGRLVDGSWEALVGLPGDGCRGRSRGLSMISAISGAHLAAIRASDLQSFIPRGV